jgi:cytochrome c oxidase subunit 2
MTATRRKQATALTLPTIAATGCAGAQSALDPAGAAAEEIADLFWGMTIGSLVIWIAVVALAVYASYARAESDDRRGQRLIVLGGVVAPTIVLAGLLIYGLAMLPPMLAAAPEGSRVIEVTGEQYWWRIRYPTADGDQVELANELRLAVGEPVTLRLTSRDVIHSFWVPALAGKMDMFPGRFTQLTLHPTRTGDFRGVCAELCGASHALMAFRVAVVAPDELTRWIAAQAAPAQRAEGEELFIASGCGACHTVRGTGARGAIGPDLTHVGSRLSLAAATLPNDRAAFEHWLSDTAKIKPGVHMPHFGMLPETDRRALAAYLEALQ